VAGEIPKYDKPPLSQKDVLKEQATTITECFASCGLDEPTHEEVRAALERYRMFAADEIDQMLAAL